MKSPFRPIYLRSTQPSKPLALANRDAGLRSSSSEVRNLAQRSATAAKEIKDLIQDSVKKVNEGTKLVEESGSTLDEIVGATKKVSQIIAEIATASKEQSLGIEQVNTAVMDLDSMTQQNAALVEETAASSNVMGDRAEAMMGLIGFFKIDGAGSQRYAEVQAKSPNSGNTSVERRSAGRPWDTASPEPNRHTPVASSGGGEWAEF